MWIKYNKQLTNTDNSFTISISPDNFIRITGVDDGSTGLYGIPKEKFEPIIEFISYCISQDIRLIDIDQYLIQGTQGN